MGTRGAFGVYVNDETKVSYNHFDSYPEGLGVSILGELKTMLETWGEANLKAKAIALRLVDEHGIPCQGDIDEYIKFANITVGNQTYSDWYCLLRDLQGDLTMTLQVGVMIDSKNFLEDSLFCEWAYIVNLDSRELEVYQGFQDKPHTKGRYATIPTFKNISGSTYYPVALIATYSFDSLPEAKDFIEKCDPREGGEE